MLADDGALVLKFWMHLDRDAQKERLEALQKDPLEAWRVDKSAWRNWKRYDRFQTAAERIVQHSSRGHAPWALVEGRDARYRFVRVATALRDALRARLASPTPPPTEGQAPTPPLPGQPTLLRNIDTSRTLEHGKYKRKLKREQARSHALFLRAKEAGRSVVVVLEGWDAAGKGGAIARLTAALDPRDYNVIATAAPTDEERAHHYLWRFWRHMTRAGRLLVFDRSWYGRVLVERVEGFARPDEWARAYAEIRDFEQHLVRHGIVLVKVWMHITPEEQLRRFEERKEKPYKRWKLTDEDWRNRERWPDYEVAFDDLVQRTSTSEAPWHVIAADDKKVARVEMLERFNDAIEAALGGS
jgi:polyphosphate:AMP phosphotransferase